MKSPSTLRTVKHPNITWVYCPLQFASGVGMAAKIGVFRVEVRFDSDGFASLFIPQVSTNGNRLSIGMSGLPDGDPVDFGNFEELLDRCVGFLQRRLESALEEIGG